MQQSSNKQIDHQYIKLALPEKQPSNSVSQPKPTKPRENIDPEEKGCAMAKKCLL